MSAECSTITKSRVRDLIYLAVDELNDQLQDAKVVEKAPETRLFGREGILDSLELVHLIAASEEQVEDGLGICIVLADERAMSRRHSPFASLESLTDYVYELVNALTAERAGRVA